MSTHDRHHGGVNADESPSREPAVHVSSTGNSVVLQLRLPPRRAQILSRAKSLDSLEIRYRRMKCAVVVMATLMITASILLVGVSLAMAEHIDELVRQMSGLATSTVRTTTTTTTTTTVWSSTATDIT